MSVAGSKFERLRQPGTLQPLRHEGDALVAPDGARYPIKNGIPRFVPAESYADDFGWQWNEFRQTQLDSHSGTTISRDRLARHFAGHLNKLKGKRVLEVGSGAGRFSEILVAEGAELYSLDLSHAVEANALNNGLDNMLLVQADARYIPFEPASFDYVLCIGVVQHTPDPEETMRSLYKMVKPGGYMITDHYAANWRWRVWPPIGYAVSIYRPIILAMKRAKRFAAVRKIVNFWFPIHWALRDSKLARSLMPRISPVAFYYPLLPLRNKQQHYEWALLDTHDNLTDYYKHLRSVDDTRKTLQEFGASEIAVSEAGNGVEAFCRKPA